MSNGIVGIRPRVEYDIIDTKQMLHNEFDAGVSNQTWCS